MNNSGVLSGGWEFVTAAYLLSLVVLSCYALAVVMRYRKELGRVGRQSEHNEGSE